MANKNLNTRIVLRNDTKANWQSVNPILMKGEFGVEFDPSAAAEGRKILFKIGDGVTAWNDLPYGGGDFAEVIAEMQRDIIQLQQALPIEEYDATNTVSAAIRAVDTKANNNKGVLDNLTASVGVAGSIDYKIAEASQALNDRIDGVEDIIGDGFTASQSVAAAISATNAAVGVAQATANAAATAAASASSAAAAAQESADSAASVAAAAQERADAAYTLASQANAAAVTANQAITVLNGTTGVAGSVLNTISNELNATGGVSDRISNLENILPKDSFSASQTVAGALSALDDRIDALEGNHFIVVDVLPATGQSNVIYLVPDANVGYKEWIYIKTGSNPDVYAWEEIGDTNIDLSNYYTKTESDGRYAPITHNHDDRYYTQTYVDQHILDENQDQSLAYRIKELENAGYATATWVSNNFVGKSAYTQDQATIASHFDTIDQQLDPSRDQSLPSRITALENDLAVVEGAYASKNYVDINFVKNNDVLILDCGNASTNYSAS